MSKRRIQITDLQKRPQNRNSRLFLLQSVLKIFWNYNLWNSHDYKDKRLTKPKIKLIQENVKTRVPGFKNSRAQAVNTQDKDYKSIEKEIIRNEKRIGT